MHAYFEFSVFMQYVHHNVYCYLLYQFDRLVYTLVSIIFPLSLIDQ